MSDRRVTIVVVPRDRFSLTKKSLESVYANTDCAFDLIYVDAGSPQVIREYLEAEATRRGFQLLRCEQFLTPNEARNLALRHARTPYVVFLDNDTLVSPGWLAHLVACADETGAWVVGPLYMEDEGTSRIHMAGGRASIVERGGKRHFVEGHFLLGVTLDAVGPHMQRGPTELLEFHCVLVRRDVFDRFGWFDEGYLSCRDCIDLCLLVREAGKLVFLEPRAVVTHLRPPPLDKMDLPYFWLRWSEAWNRASMEHFRDKWQLSDDDPSYAHHLTWLNDYRKHVLYPYRRALKPLGRRAAQFIDKYVYRPLEPMLNRRAYSSDRSHVQTQLGDHGDEFAADGERSKILAQHAAA
jgi:GT2 family glycosyltransferase